MISSNLGQAMRSTIYLFLSAALLTVAPTQVSAETEEQMQAVKAMGALYGIALPCKYLQQTRRIKSGMVENLPKKRYLGQVFEQATNESFLDFTRTGVACPGETEMAAQIDAAIQELQSQFKVEATAQ